MKLCANRLALADAVRASAGAAGTTLPILSGARIDVAGKVAVVTCSNLDLTIRATVDADEGVDGSVIVPASLLAGFLKATEGEFATLTADGEGPMTAEVGETTITVPALRLEEWPKLATAKGKGVEVSPAHLADLGKIVGFAYSNPSAPIPNLSGVCITNGRAEATDRYRLARLELGVDVAGPVIIPAAALAVVIRGAGNRVVTLRIDDRRATFAADGLEWTTALVEGDFPELDRLIRPTSPYRVEFPTERLIQAVKRVALVSEDQDRQAMTFMVDGGKTTIRNRSKERGEIVDVVPSVGEMPEPFSVSGRLLRDLLNNVDEDVVGFEMENARKPIEVRTERLLQLVMPVADRPGVSS